MKSSILAAAVSLLVAGSLAHADKIVIKGSDTLGAKLVPQLAEAYKASHPDTTFEIAAEGSTTGIAAIIEGTADIGMSSRRAKPTEISDAASKNVNMTPTIVAYDGIGIIVNSANPVKSLTKRQIEQIFTGAITDWSAVGGAPGPISVYTRNTASGTYQDFKDMAMSKKDYGPQSQKLAGNEQIASEVGKNKNGVGYVGLAYLKAPGVKVVPVDLGGKLTVPTKASVQSKEYPFARPTFFYTNGKPAGKAADFLAFLFSPAGHKIVDQVGFVPAN